MTPFTPKGNQKEAIENPSFRLLVSASAGTGKTSVMIERLVQQILSRAVTVEQILVVTFTNLASCEMKQRLNKALANYASQDYIKAQCEKIDLSSISTLHSFCLETLRTYFYVVDIDPNFNLVDPMLANSYKDKVFDEVLKEYNKAHNEDFYRLCQIYNLSRGNKAFKEEIYKLYEFSRCLPDFNKWFEDTLKNYESANSQFLQVLHDDFVTTSQDYSRTFYDFAIKAKHLGATKLASHCEYLSSYFAVAPSQSFDILLTNFFQREKMQTFSASCKQYDTAFHISQGEFVEFVEIIKDTLDSAKKNIIEKYTKLDGLKPSEQLKTASQSLPILRQLASYITSFNDAYYVYKKERALLDFADLEHLTLNVLDNDQARAELSARYKQVYVDEYQDINSVQEEIISRLSQCSSLFMVGDVKQSIYGFRQCDPNIFLDKKQSFVNQASSSVVELNDNFRADNRILEEVNKVFNYCMTANFGKVDYLNTANLHSEKLLFNPATPFSIVRVEEDDDKPEVVAPYDITDISNYVEGEDNNEAKTIVSLVKSLVGSIREFEEDGNRIRRAVTYNDITILCRTGKHQSKSIYLALKQENIPVVTTLADKYSGKECADLINFLRVLDNPYNDIYFVGVALSCFGGFTQDDLSLIKHSVPCSSWFDAFVAFGGKDAEKFNFLLGQVQTTNKDNFQQTKTFQEINQIDIDDIFSYQAVSDTTQVTQNINQQSIQIEELGKADKERLTDKVCCFLRLINDYLLASYTLSVDALLQRLTLQFDYNLHVLSLPNGQSRLVNFQNFLQEIYGKSYSQSVSKYLQYIDLYDEQESSGDVTASQGVFMTTIHKSKGLEFPIVIGANISGEFINDKSKVSVDKRLGFAMENYDFENMTSSPSLTMFATRMFASFTSKEEELRLLYVLMTRAKNQLILVVTVKKDKQIVNARLATSIKDFVLYGAKKANIPIVSNLNNLSRGVYCQDLPTQNTNEQQFLADINYAYPFKKNLSMPLKVTASGIKWDEDETIPYTFDLSNGEEVKEQSLNDIIVSTNKTYFELEQLGLRANPANLAVTNADHISSLTLVGNAISSNATILNGNTTQKQPQLEELDTVSASLLGTAYHKVFERLQLDSSIQQVNQVVQTLISENVILQQVGDILDQAQIAKCSSNPQLKTLCLGQIYHEAPFLASLPYSKIFPTSDITDNVTLQGIIDLLIINGRQINIIDFKYASRSDKLRERYLAQMTAYTLAVKQIFASDNVSSYIMSIKDNLIIKVN